MTVRFRRGVDGCLSWDGIYVTRGCFGCILRCKGMGK